MRVGIITVHSVPNYGAVLQAYALASYLRSTGRNVTTIDYRQPHLEEVYRLKWRFPPPINNWLRHRRNSDFVQNQLPLSATRYRSKEQFLPDVNLYDAFITGSDQVWFTGPGQNFDPMYFLEFSAPGKRKLSYAPSVGGSKDFGPYAERVRAALADYTSVSARDSHTAALVQQVTGREPVQVADPVFLWHFDELIERKSNEPYVLVFGNFNGPLDPVLRAIVAETGIRNVVSLQYPCDAATQRVSAPSPGQWISAFRHASFVVTSYFHGSAIAAKFQRPFIAIPTPGRRIKVQTMLAWMGLERRCFLSDPTPTEAAARARETIDWQTAAQLTEQRVAASKNYLKSALN